MGKFSIKKTFNSVKNHVNNLRPYTGSILGTFAAPFTMGQSLQWGSQYDMMKMQNQMQNEQIERQNELNMQMWNLQNEYNSPYSQMQRYKNAGLNPNLIYGNISSGNATSAPEMTATNSSNSALALASVIGQAGGDISNFSKSIAKMMLGKVIEDFDLNLLQKQENINNTKAQTKQVLKSVDNQAPSRYNPISNVGKTALDVINMPRLGYEIGKEYMEKHNLQGLIPWVQEGYYKGKEIAHMDNIYFRMRGKGKSIAQANKIAYGNKTNLYQDI